MLVAGAVAAVVGLWSAGRRVERTRYRPEEWRLAELVVSPPGSSSPSRCWRVRTRPVPGRLPGGRGGPDVSALALVGVLVGLVPAVAAPPPTSSRAALARAASRGTSPAPASARAPGR